MADEEARWDELYRTGGYQPRSEPSPLLESWIHALPPGRALDVATGTGRNALFLAGHGFEVEAVDVSGEALDAARERADERGVSVDWIHSDVDEFSLRAHRYDAVVVSFYYRLGVLPDLKAALAPGGVLLYEHHLRTTDPVDRGPSSAAHRLRSNDLLRNALDLTVLHYEEGTREVEGGVEAVATLAARNSAGGTQSYPRRP